MYRVIYAFNDLNDNSRSYRVGEEFPRPGLRVTKARLKELSTDENKAGIQLIEYVPDETEDAPKPRKRVSK